ncbi:MAG TPA: exopolysaccharide biosynthesis protein [Geothrix sp.]|nr:exopolysaccharide biosynthesis protein [Geothrix sp.]
MSLPGLSAGTGRPYGTALVLLAAMSVVPGIGTVTGPLVGLASLLLGVQLALGRPEPWLPAWLSRRVASAERGSRFSTWIQERCRPIMHLAPPRFPDRLAGLTVAWSSLLLILPLAFVPLGNTIPSLSVGLVGAGLLAGRGPLGWLGLLLSGGYSLVLVLLGETLFLAAQALIRRLT